MSKNEKREREKKQWRGKKTKKKEAKKFPNENVFFEFYYISYTGDPY